MNNQSQTMSDNMCQLAEDVGALMSATAHVAGEHVEGARKRVAIALEQSKAIYEQLRGKVVEGAKAADEIVHKNPYQGIAIGVGIGVVIGYFMTRR